MTEAVFERDGERYLPTKLAGSPWGDDMVHGGPPAGLLARAIESLGATAELRVVRLTVDLFRPVPKVPLTVQARSVREGKRIHAVDAVLLADGVEVSRASGLLLRSTELPEVKAGGSLLPPPGPESAEERPIIPPRDARPRREGFHTASEFRRLPRAETGPAATWIRVPELVAGERMTPLVRLAATCDFVNAVGSMTSQGGGAGFINTDVTVYVSREPVGEWICLQVERTIEPDGIGVGGATIFDREGGVGRAVQALLANPMR
ncbi:MAG: thioesterase family protein [Dehalococcoidia bacterium]